MKNFFKKLIPLAMVVFMVIAISSCGPKNESSSVDPINYRLKWLFNISSAGDLWADVNGHFQRQGLTVNIKPGGPERDAIRELELGHAHFGVASADQVIRAVSKGSPVVVLVQLFQINPLQWIYRPHHVTIESPEDLTSKNIGITFGGNDETIMRALLSKYQIGENEVNFFSVRYDYTPFYQGDVDLWPIYRNAQAVIIGKRLQEANEPIAFFDPHSAGIRFVANSVVTTQKMLKDHPETVKKFTKALVSAWIEAMDPTNTEKVIEAVHHFDPDTSPEIIGEQLKITRDLTIPFGDFEKGGQFFGKIDLAAWKETENMMLNQQLIHAPVNIEQYLNVWE